MSHTSTILDTPTILSMSMQGLKLVEASAGTGKTYTIANLYLKMLLDGRKVQDILVVTFTNAATEELRGRIRRRIYDAVQHWNHPQANNDDLLAQWQQHAASKEETCKEEALKQGELRLRLALTHMDDAAIYTIHAFCQKVLTDQAFLTRQAFDVEMLTDDDLIWESALKDWWRRTIHDMDEADYAQFTQLFPKLEDLMKVQKELRKPAIQLHPKPSNMQAALNGIVPQWLALHVDIKEFLLSPSVNKRTFNESKMKARLDTWHQAFSSEHPYFPNDLEFLTINKIEGGLKKGESVPQALIPFFTLIEKHQHWKKQIKTNWLHDAHQFAKKKVADTKRQAAQLAFDDQLVHVHQAVLASDELCKAIRHDFPIALVDEFQDTDAIQYGIFRQIYQAHKKVCLMMIGDPKQAIYSFRGGDIFTYIQAKKDADARYTLDTNWRSSAGMIAAVNHLFEQHHNPFLYDSIPFEAVKSPPKQPQNTEGFAKACTLWHIPSGANGKPLNKNDASQYLHEQVAQEIANILQQSQAGTLHIGERAVQAKDIAILVRGHVEASGVRQALQQHGIAAVSAGKASVYQSDEAQGLYLLLQGMVHHSDAAVVRRALASSWFDLSYEELHKQTHDEATWVQYLEQFRALHELWANKGFIHMFYSMLQRFNFGTRLAKQAQGERNLTNALHLSELLQQASQTHSSMDALLRWFAEHLNNSDSLEETQLRLENDQNLVQISTIHAAKGLEYPIVLVPYLWACKPAQSKQVSYYDEGAQQRYVELHVDKDTQEKADQERLAEDMRLLYVALTRAKYKLYLAWGDAGSNSAKTALAYLLQQNKDDTPPCEHIEHISLELEASDAPIMAPEADATKLMPFAVCPQIPQVGRSISSFTRITQQLPYQAKHKPESVLDDDAIMQFPAGRHTGLLLHHMMEQLDFQGNIVQQVESLMLQAQYAGLFNDEQRAIVPTWLEYIVHTPLNEQHRLCDIAPQQRLNELHFDFSVQHLHIPDFNQALQDHSSTPLTPLQAKDCRGYITGEIDMVFEHDGRFYIVDYKSNHLGNSLKDYAAPALQAAIHEHRYDVQYLIYTVALHRYLSLRMADYDYETHMGGVYYLFLRGMRPEQGNKYGVFFEKPPYALIQTLDTHIFAQPIDSNQEI